MVNLVAFVVVLLFVPFAAHASGQMQLRFELTQGENKIGWGAALVTKQRSTWSKGLTRSYLQLHCKEQAGKVKKHFSTVGHFAGLSVTHQWLGDQLEITVIRDWVQPRLSEIQALSKDQCETLLPILTTIKKTYRIPAQDGLDKDYAFGENMKFRVKLRDLLKK